MRVIAVYSIKGGVGKTATAVNLAYLSARSGARTLLWDLDPQAAATFYFRVEPRVRNKLRKILRGKRTLDNQIRGTDYDQLDLLPADFSYRNLDLELDHLRQPEKRLAKLMKPLAKDYDHVYLDCSPSVSLVSEGIFAAADAIVVPTIPTTLSLRTLDQIAAHFEPTKRGKPQILPFFCMVDRRKRLHAEVIEQADAHAFPFLESSIPYSSVVEQMGTQRAPIHAFASNSPAAAAYSDLWTEVMGRTGSLVRAARARAWHPFPF